MPKLQIIKDILDERGISVSDFCKEINMSISGFKRIIERNSTRLQTLEMIAEALHCPVGVFFAEISADKQPKRDLLKPHIPISAQAGSLSGYGDPVTASACEMNASISSFGTYDYTIDVKGDSMNPTYHSGDIVACRMVNPGDPLWYGHVYVLDTPQGVVMKQIEKCLGDLSKIKCVSINNLYAPYELSLEDVYSLSLVVGHIKSI